MDKLIIFVAIFGLLMFSMTFDWIFQTNWEATNKFRNPLARFVHSLIYATLTSLLFWFFPYYPFSFYAILVVWLILLTSHYIIDSRKLVLWWMVNIKRIPKEQVYPGPNGEYPPTWWLQIGIDQCFHFIVNFLLAILLTEVM